MDDQACRATVLAPLIAEAAARMATTRIALIDLGRPAGLNLIVDRARVLYSPGPELGPPGSTVRAEATVVRGAAPPAAEVPQVVERLLLARSPLSVDQRDVVHPASPPELRDEVDAQLDMLASLPVRRVVGDPVVNLPAAIASVGADVTPVVMTTWTVARLSRPRRAELLSAVTGAGRPVAWVSAEGVGVAPSIPTYGDRPASGHSILGMVTVGEDSTTATAVGRCWRRGAILSWLG